MSNLHATTQFTILGDTLDGIDITSHTDGTHVYVSVGQDRARFTLAAPVELAIPLLRRLLCAAMNAHDEAVMPAASAATAARLWRDGAHWAGGWAFDPPDRERILASFGPNLFRQPAEVAS